MANLAIHVEGLKELDRAFKKAGLEDAPREVRASNLAIAQRIAARASEMAPKGSRRDPHAGRLAGNIRATATPRGANVKVGGARVPYAPPEHWGYVRAHDPGSNARSTRAHARMSRTGRSVHFARKDGMRPFLLDALEAERGSVIPEYEAALGKVLEGI